MPKSKHSRKGKVRPRHEVHQRAHERMQVVQKAFVAAKRDAEMNKAMKEMTK